MNKIAYIIIAILTPLIIGAGVSHAHEGPERIVDGKYNLQLEWNHNIC